MIVLDTNIVSALMYAPLDAPLAAWLKRHRSSPMAITAVTVMEIRHGIERLPEGRRRSDLEASFERLIAKPRGLDVLDLGESAARAAGAFLALRERLGRRADEPDMMIAGIAATIGAAIATRNMDDFFGLAIPIENPYQAG